MIQAQATMRRIGLELIDEKRQNVADQWTSTRGGANKLYEEDGITPRLWRDVNVDVAEPSKRERENLRTSAPPNQSCDGEVSKLKGLEGRDLLSVLSEYFNSHPTTPITSCPHSQIQHVLCTFPTNERRRSVMPDLDLPRGGA